MSGSHFYLASPLSTDGASSRFARNPGRVFWISFLLTLAVYVYTLAPSIVLRDSGELITAAVNLGVPHPPGYPLLTILSWLFTKLPLGTVAWRVNLLNATCGAASIGVFSLIMYFTGHLLFRNRCRPEGAVNLDGTIITTSITAALILAFSNVMWSQSVLAEKYALNTLCLSLILLFLLFWIMDPRRLRWLYLSLFFFGLGLTAHQTLLFLFPALLAAVFLTASPGLPRDAPGRPGLRRRLTLMARACFEATVVHDGLFKRFLVFSILFFNSVFAVLAILSSDSLLLDTCLRLHFLGDALLCLVILSSPGLRVRAALVFPPILAALCYLLFVIIAPLDDPVAARAACLTVVTLLTLLSCGLLALDRAHHNRFAITAFAVTWAGLSVYAYLYFSSSTNPPMNWGYASTRQGFYHAISRGQYENNLPSSIKRFVAPILLVSTPPPPPGAIPPGRGGPAGAGDAARKFCGKLGLYFEDLIDNFTLWNVALIVVGLCYVRSVRRAGRIWLVFILCSFFLLSVALTVMLGEANDRTSRWIIRVFYLPSHFIYAMFIGYGLTALHFLLSARRLQRLAQAICLLLVWTVAVCNWAGSEQRGHDYGWRYGHDMLKDLDRNAVVYGGTDPGRFVPTYMIFVESFQPPGWKRDPKFDRRDLYIITQNALADQTYMNYIRDHYDVHRPKMDRWYHRLLGRDKLYPGEPLILPNDQEFNLIFSSVVQAAQSQPNSGITFIKDALGNVTRANVEGLEGVFAINGAIAEWIFKQNREKHTFYVEESYPLPWMYPYMEPAGLIMKLNKDPLARLSDEGIARDHAYWTEYTRSLMTDPRFLRDEDARKAFSKLRLSLGGLYAWRAFNNRDPRCLNEAEFAYKQALELCPFAWESAARYVDLLCRQERYTDALQVLNRYQTEDPLNPAGPAIIPQIQQQMNLLNLQHQLEPVAAACPTDPNVNVQLLQTYVQRNRMDLFQQLAPKVLRIKAVPSNARSAIAQTYAGLGKLEESLAAVESIVKVEPGNAEGWYEIAVVRCALKRNDPGLDALEKALRLNAQFYAQVATDPRFESVRALPRFQQILYGQSPAKSKQP